MPSQTKVTEEYRYAVAWRGGYAVVCQVPLRSSLDFNCTFLKLDLGRTF